jgi:hypothetical protein
MTYFSPPTELLSVVVQVCAGNRENVCAVGNAAQEIEHCHVATRIGCAERPAENRAQVILELARFRSFDGPMPRIVDSRRDLVGDETR